jgi:bifunctional DNA-binding transcriptional regulator/antitoxin component of YhaV-PrlF toxin-antitoxin module
MSDRPIITKVLPGYKVTVPEQVCTLYGLQEGDVFEWKLEGDRLVVTPKRPNLITPEVEAQIMEIRRRHEQH